MALDTDHLCDADRPSADEHVRLLAHSVDRAYGRCPARLSFHRLSCCIRFPGPSALGRVCLPANTVEQWLELRLCILEHRATDASVGFCW